MKIVRLNSRLVPEVERLEASCFAHPWSRQSIEEYLCNPDAHFFVALSDEGEIKGYIGTYIVCDEAYVTNLAVFEQFRRQGVGLALAKRALQNAESCGASFLSLEVRLSNEPAIKLYSSLGFVKDGIRPDFYRDPDEDAYIMTKRFDEG